MVMENFDKNLKEKINKYYSTVDPNEIWAGIQRKRKKDKKKIIIPLFRIAAILILLIGITFTLNLEKIFNKNGINNYLAKNNNYNNLNKNFNIQIDKSENIAKSEINNNDYNKLNNNKLQNNKKNNISSKTNNLFDDINDSKSNFADNLTAKNNDSVYLNSSNEILINKSILKDQTDFFKNENLINNINIPLNQFTRLHYYLNLTPQICATIEKKRSNKRTNEINFDLSPQYAFRQINAYDESSQIYADNIRNNEKFLESFDIKILFKKSVYENFYFGTGLRYSQIDRKLDFKYKTSETYEDNNVLSRMVLNMPGDTIRYYSTKMVTANYQINEKIYNYNKKIQLPLSIGYHGKIGKLDYEISTGLNLTILDFSKGRMITPEGKTIGIKDSNNNLLKKSIFNNIDFAITLRKQLHKNIYVYFGPDFKYGFNSYNRTSGIKVNENTIGINLGLKYKF